MRTIKHCIRCRKETLLGTTNKTLTPRESEAIQSIVILHLVEVQYDNIVCHECRHFIGDEIADNILKIFNNENDS